MPSTIIETTLTAKTDNYQANIKKAAKSTETLTKAASRNTKELGRARVNMTQVGFQLQDIAIQSQLSTSAFTILTQQGGALSAALGFGGLTGIVVTVAGVVGGLLYSAFGKSSDNADRLKESLAALQKQTKITKDQAAAFTATLVEDNVQIVKNSASTQKAIVVLEQQAKNRANLDSSVERSTKALAKLTTAETADRAELAKLNTELNGYTKQLKDNVKEIEGYQRASEGLAFSTKESEKAINDSIKALKIENEEFGQSAVGIALLAAVRKDATAEQLTAIATEHAHLAAKQLGADQAKAAAVLIDKEQAAINSSTESIRQQAVVMEARNAVVATSLEFGVLSEQAEAQRLTSELAAVDASLAAEEEKGRLKEAIAEKYRQREITLNEVRNNTLSEQQASFLEAQADAAEINGMATAESLALRHEVELAALAIQFANLDILQGEHDLRARLSKEHLEKDKLTLQENATFAGLDLLAVLGKGNDKFAKASRIALAGEAIYKGVSAGMDAYKAGVASGLPYPANEIAGRAGQVASVLQGVQAADKIKGGREHGGEVIAGNAYMVGEGGASASPELFVPSQSGEIIPNNELGNESVGGTGGSTIIINAIDGQSVATMIEDNQDLFYDAVQRSKEDRWEG